jgi:hypothetical protein
VAAIVTGVERQANKLHVGLPAQIYNLYQNVARENITEQELFPLEAHGTSTLGRFSSSSPGIYI